MLHTFLGNMSLPLSWILCTMHSRRYGHRPTDRRVWLDRAGSSLFIMPVHYGVSPYCRLQSPLQHNSGAYRRKKSKTQKLRFDNNYKRGWLDRRRLLTTWPTAVRLGSIYGRQCRKWRRHPRVRSLYKITTSVSSSLSYFEFTAPSYKSSDWLIDWLIDQMAWCGRRLDRWRLQPLTSLQGQLH